MLLPRLPTLQNGNANPPVLYAKPWGPAPPPRPTHPTGQQGLSSLVLNTPWFDTLTLPSASPHLRAQASQHRLARAAATASSLASPPLSLFPGPHSHCSRGGIRHRAGTGEFLATLSRADPCHLCTRYFPMAWNDHNEIRALTASEGLRDWAPASTPNSLLSATLLQWHRLSFCPQTHRTVPKHGPFAGPGSGPSDPSLCVANSSWAPALAPRPQTSRTSLRLKQPLPSATPHTRCALCRCPSQGCIPCSPRGPARPGTSPRYMPRPGAESSCPHKLAARKKLVKINEIFALLSISSLWELKMKYVLQLSIVCKRTKRMAL